MSGPRDRITAPLATTRARRLGLIPAARAVGTLVEDNRVTDASAQFDTDALRWIQGVEFEPEGCTMRGGVYDHQTCSAPTKTITDGPAQVQAEAFTIWEADECSPFQAQDRDARSRAQRSLIASQSRQVEYELWRGDQTRSSSWPNRFLASQDSDVVTDGVAVTPGQALACLEQGLAQCGWGPRGMIHATPQVISAWAEANLLIRDGLLLLTYNDNVVVSGTGYDGSGPPGSEGGEPVAAAEGSIWAYATPMIEVRLGPIIVVPGDDAAALDRSVNTLTYRAERAALAFFDECCHIAAEIDLPLCGVGGAGS